MDFGFWILDFGFWILDFGSWILDFGFWSLDFGFWISLVFVLFAAAPNGAVWILDFGVWILEFGFWILDFGLDEASTDIVWILHKIFPCHADSGRRVLRCLWALMRLNLIGGAAVSCTYTHQVLTRPRSLVCAFQRIEV